MFCYALIRDRHLLVDIIARYSLPMTTVSSIETADGVKTTIEQLHNEFSQDVRPPCKVLCYAVSAGYSRVKNSETSKNLQDSTLCLVCKQSCWVTFSLLSQCVIFSALTHVGLVIEMVSSS